MQIVGEIETLRHVDILQSIPPGRFHKIVNTGRLVGGDGQEVANNADMSFG